jgi:nucleotide-binding universal stress UspA family protein
MPAEPVFERVLLVHTDEHPQADLLEYTALLASFTLAGEAVVATYPSNGVLRQFTPAAQRSFQSRRLATPAVEILSEPDVDGVLETARRHKAGLVVMRHPMALDSGKNVAKRILTECPCSVLFVPPDARPVIRRVVAGFDVDAAGQALLDRTVEFCYAARVEELAGVHATARETKLDRSMALFRLLGHVNLEGLACTPVLADDSAPARALARVATERGADLIVVGRRPGASPRVALALLEDCPFPVMQILLPVPAAGVRGLLRRIFAGSNPSQ